MDEESTPREATEADSAVTKAPEISGTAPSQAEQEATTPSAAPKFNAIDAAIGVILHPTGTMNRIALARPWLSALVLLMVISLLNSLASLTTPAPDLGSGVATSSQIGGTTAAVLGFLRSPAWVAIQTLLVAPISLAFGVAVLYLFAKILGGKGRYSALFSTVAYASTPAIIGAPIVAWLNLAGGLVAILSATFSLGMGLWSLVLQVIALKESMRLSTGRAIAALIVPMVLLIGLVVVVGVVVAIVALQSAGSLN